MKRILIVVILLIYPIVMNAAYITKLSLSDDGEQLIITRTCDGCVMVGIIVNVPEGRVIYGSLVRRNEAGECLISIPLAFLVANHQARVCAMIPESMLDNLRFVGCVSDPGWVFTDLMRNETNYDVDICSNAKSEKEYTDHP